MELIIIYGITTLISLLLVAGYLKLIDKRQNWFVFLYVSVFVVNAGYLWLAASKTLESALMANRVAYFGSVFLPLCILMVVLTVCRVNYPKWLKYILMAISIIVFLIASTGGITDWYYEDVVLKMVNGAATLIKVYGSLHAVYYIYLAVYFIMMAAVICVQWTKGQNFERKHALLLLAVVFGNIMIWFIEQGIDSQFEFLSVSYIVTEVFLLMLYSILQDYSSMRNPVRPELELRNMSQEQLVEKYPLLKELTSREMEVAVYLLQDKRRKDIAEILSVTEHTIKKHTAHIFMKMEVSDRRELREKLGIQ